MESTAMEEPLASYPTQELKEDSVLKGVITEIHGKEVAIDIGRKGERVILAPGLNDIESLEVGSEIDIYIEHSQDNYGNPLILHDKALQKKSRH
jgi:small subunit ribosomal protein S1